MSIHLSYSPTHSAPELLEQLTISEERHQLIDTLVTAVKSELNNQTHQHQLLIGARGMGKTHTLTLVYHRLSQDLSVWQRIYPVILPEDIVARQPADLFLRILEQMARTPIGEPADKELQKMHLKAAQYADDVRRCPKSQNALALAADCVEDLAQGLNRLLVISIENIDLLLYTGASGHRKESSDPQWALRQRLQDSQHMMWLTAAPTPFGGMMQVHAPFYNFFRTHILEELSPESILALIRKRIEMELGTPIKDPARKDLLQDVLDHFSEREPQLRGVLALTGGLPRFAHLLFDIVLETDISQSYGVLCRFLDEQTPYFQTRLDPRVIPETELEVLDILALSPGPLTVTQISQQMRGGALNAASTFLKRLQERMLVKKIALGKRDVRYDVAEPLFRVWRRFRVGVEEQERLMVLAQFVAALYTKQTLLMELEQLTKHPEKDMRSQLLTMALEQQKKYQITQITQKEKKTLKKKISQANEWYKNGKIIKALKQYDALVEHVSRSQDADVLVALFRGLLSTADIELVLSQLDKMLLLIQIQDLKLLLATFYLVTVTGMFLSGNKLEALKVANKIIQVCEKLDGSQEKSIVLIGYYRLKCHILMKSEQYSDALDAIDKALYAFKALDSFDDNAAKDLNSIYLFASLGHQKSRVLAALNQPLEGLQFLESAIDLLETTQKIILTKKRSSKENLVEFVSSLMTFHAFRSELLNQLECSPEALEALHQTILYIHKFIESTKKSGNIDVAYYMILNSFSQAISSFKPILPILLQDSAYHQQFSDLLETSKHWWEKVILFKDGSLLLDFLFILWHVQGPEAVLRWLLALESRLPENRANFLRPLKLALQIQCGLEHDTLPSESEEMRRTVREVFKRYKSVVLPSQN